MNIFYFRNQKKDFISRAQCLAMTGKTSLAPLVTRTFIHLKLKIAKKKLSITNDIRVIAIVKQVIIAFSTDVSS